MAANGNLPVNIGQGVAGAQGAGAQGPGAGGNAGGAAPNVAANPPAEAANPPAPVIAPAADGTFDARASIAGLFANGPVICGAVQDKDAFDANLDGVWIGLDGGNSTYEIALAAFQSVPTNCTRTSALAIAGLAAIVHIYRDIASPDAARQVKPEWYSDAEGEAAEAVAAGAQAPPAAHAAFDPAELSDGVKRGLSLLIAAKVNYWKTNHHTGVGAPVGYFLKALAQQDLANKPTTMKDTKYLWKAVHWFDTKACLAAMGVQNVTVSPVKLAAAKSLIELSDDAMLRIRSNPAGTAKWADVWAGVLMVETNAVYRRHGPTFPKPREYYDELYAILQSGDCNYHMGARYLCDSQRVMIGEFSEDVVNWVYTCVYLMNESSTLLRAQVFEKRTASSTIARSIKDTTLAIAESMADTVGEGGMKFADGHRARRNRRRDVDQVLEAIE